MQPNYFENVWQYAPSFIKIELDEATINKVDKFIAKVIAKKSQEAHHQIDNAKEFTRWKTGVLGECAVEKYLGKKFVSFRVGDSKTHNYADLKPLGFDCGIKTSEYGKYPIVAKPSVRDEIIVVKFSDSVYYLCGLATPKVLNAYQTDDYILSPALKARGTKSAFYGFDKLHSPEKVLNLILCSN